MTTPPFDAPTEADIAEVSRQLGRPARGVIGIAARCVCGNPTVVATHPRLPDGTPFPTLYYLSHPAATASISTLEATGVMPELAAELADDEIADQYRQAHEQYLLDRDSIEAIPEISGYSAGGMPDRVKCLHALAAHSLAAGPGVNPIGDLALERATWSPERCQCAGLRFAAAVVLVIISLAVPSSALAASTDLVRSKEYWLDAYGIRTAWNTTQGAGVTIAIIDTGIAGGVRDLAGAVVGGTDFSGQGASNGQSPVGGAGENEHGTMVASLAAGRGTGSNSGVIGAAPQASLLAISIGFGGEGDESDQQIADAVRWAVDNGADVINMSLTRNTLDWPESWDDAFLYAMQHDVVVVAAAGNRGSGTVEVGAPATMPGVLTVSGVDRNGNASFDASSQGITIGVAAPSEELVGVYPDGGYVTWSGTSGATPIVAGIVALVRAAHPELDAANVINRIVATARDVGDPGTDFTYGYGLVDAAAAVTADVEPVDENPVGDLAEWIRVNRRADATPTPGAIVPPVTAPEVVAVPVNPTGTLLPSVTSLQLVGIPSLVVVLLLTVLGGLVVAAVRQFGSGRRTR